MDDATVHLLAAAAGDRDAVSRLVAATQADVWRFCAHLVDVDSADDLTQDTYVRAMGAVDRFRGASSARTWLLAIARHACADELRRRVRRRTREVQVDDATAGGWRARDDESHADLAMDVERALALVDEDQRAAFVLTQVIGLSYREAAEALDVPVGTIRSRVARARQKVVTSLGEQDPEVSSRPRQDDGDRWTG